VNKLLYYVLRVEMGTEQATSVAGWRDSATWKCHDWEWGGNTEWSTVGRSAGQSTLWSITVWTGAFLSWGM